MLAGHVCGHFRTEDEREVAHLVIGALFNEGTLAVVTEDHRIVDAAAFGRFPEADDEEVIPHLLLTTYLLLTTDY